MHRIYNFDNTKIRCTLILVKHTNIWSFVVKYICVVIICMLKAFDYPKKYTYIGVKEAEPKQ